MKASIPEIANWRQFIGKIRPKDSPLLIQTMGTGDLIFVTGCQRSGTTMVTDLFRLSNEIAPYQTALDSELEGALILGGYMDARPAPGKRRCFQTTYLDDHFTEYFTYSDQFQLIFVVRNPVSVVYSMLHHWTRRVYLRNYALNDVFLNCGRKGLVKSELLRFRLLGSLGVSRLRKACLSYNEKTGQLFHIVSKLGERVLVVEYDTLIQNKERMLPRLFKFVDLPYAPSFADHVKAGSLRKGASLSPRKQELIREACMKTYKKAAALAIKPDDPGGK